jgi:predicted RNase H-like HicB family nuclease
MIGKGFTPETLLIGLFQPSKGLNGTPRKIPFDLSVKRGLAISHIVSHNYRMKKEFVFQIEQDDDMLVATCHEPEMATQGENLDELLAMIRDLIRCRFDDGDERLAWPIRLHFLHDPVLSAQVA